MCDQSNGRYLYKCKLARLPEVMSHPNNSYMESGIQTITVQAIYHIRTSVQPQTVQGNYAAGQTDETRSTAVRERLTHGSIRQTHR